MSEPESTTVQIQHWLERLRQGDPRARNELLQHACTRLRKLTRRMFHGFPRLRRWEQTDDVLQNALIRLYRALSETAPESVQHFFNLAATQIRRELLDLAKHHFGPEGPGARHDTDGGSGHQPEVAVNDEPANLDEWTDFHRQVEALPDDEREVFNLLWYEELSHDEAAALLGLSPRTLRRRWKAAKVKLYDALRKRSHGDA